MASTLVQCFCRPTGRLLLGCWLEVMPDAALGGCSTCRASGWGLSVCNVEVMPGRDHLGTTTQFVYKGSDQF